MQHTRILMTASGLIAVSAPLWAAGCGSFFDDCTNGLCTTFKDAGAAETAAAGGAMTAASSGGMGGAMTAASSGGVGSGGCMPQGSDDTVCGPAGDDGNCDGVMGDCNTQRIYVGVRTIGDTTSCSDNASDVFMSDDKSEVEAADFQVISEFKTFTSKLQGTTELSRCNTGGAKNNKATISNLAPMHARVQWIQAPGLRLHDACRGV